MSEADGFVILEPDEAERLHLGRTRWFAQCLLETDERAAQTLLTVDEELWQQVRSISLLALTLQEAGMDPGAEIDAGVESVGDKRINRFVTRWGHPKDWD